MKKILIIGKSGFIAQKLLSRNSSYLATSSNKNTTNHTYLDLQTPQDFDYSHIDSDTTIVLLAAISSPDICNNKYKDAYEINVSGTSFFIEASIARGANVLFFSSDVVYGNQTSPSNEDAASNPFGKYAEMKDMIERHFVNEPKFKVFRLSYVLSSEDKYLKYLKSCIENNHVAEIFHPFYRKIIYIEDVLDAIEAIIDKWNEYPNQKFNICGTENISRKQLAEWYNTTHDNVLKYVIITPSEKFWEARPKDINIISKYLTNLIEREPTSIHEAIQLIRKEEING